MAKLMIKAFDAEVKGSGVSISLGSAKAGQYFRIGFTKYAQLTYFGRALDPEKDALILDLDNAAGRVHLLDITLGGASDAVGLSVSASARGSVYVRVSPWVKVAAGKRPAKELLVSHSSEVGRFGVKLPEWARPEPMKLNQGVPLMDT